MRLKDQSVLFSELRHGRRYSVSPYVLESLHIAEELWVAYGAKELVITSMVEKDTWHTRYSEHWQGNASDGRIWNLPGVTMLNDHYKDRDGLLTELRDEFQDRLGPDFRVILEPNHMHWDNKPERVYRRR